MPEGTGVQHLVSQLPIGAFSHEAGCGVTAAFPPCLPALAQRKAELRGGASQGAGPGFTGSWAQPRVASARLEELSSAPVLCSHTKGFLCCSLCP